MKTDENLEISVISTTEETAIVPSVFNESRSHRIKRYVCCIFHSLLPSKKQLNLAFTKSILLLLFCGSIFGILQENALPGTETFSLILLAVLSFLGGQLFGMIQLPPLVGMLIVGFLYGNLSVLPFSANISHKTASTIRDVALVIILLTSGVGLDGQKLHRLKRVILQLTCIPLLVEVGSMTVLAHFFLGLPWAWGVMLGFIVSAVSVAVVLPILLRLRRKGLGNDKGIPTLILAASSMDDIVSITGFTITLSIVFSEGGLTLILIKAPLEPLVGCAVGAVFGVLFWHFPSRNTTKAPLLVYYNVLLLCLGGLCLMLVSERFSLSGSGALGCVTLAFVSTLAWRKNPQQMAGIESVIGILWKVMEPFMFALIGAEVSMDNLHSHIGYSLLSLFLALLCRLLVTPFVTFGANLNAKEKVFVSCAWLPKAAVQAAIGSQALDYARLKGKGTEMIGYGEQLLTVSVLSILLTAPLGAALTAFLGPRLLSKDLNACQTSVNREETADTTVKKLPSNYGACHQLQPSDVLPPPKAPENHIPS